MMYGALNMNALNMNVCVAGINNACAAIHTYIHTYIHTWRRE